MIEYWEYDGIYHRLRFSQESGELEKAEGYFKGQGFVLVDSFSVLREGEQISEKDFKAAIVALR